jgi:ribonuclease-3
LADTLEAVIGAVFLDGGITAVNHVVTSLFTGPLKDLASDYTEESSNPKGTLQEIIQSMDCALPTYTIVKESGPPHDRTFIAEVQWQGHLLGTAAGATKKAAETEAARAALRHPKVLDCQQ